MNPSSEIPSDVTRVSRPIWRALMYAGILGYLLFAAWHGLSARFSPDDMMNLGRYWLHGPAKVFEGGLLFFTNYYRPAGGLFYLPVFSYAGLDPAPYRAVCLVLLGANLWLFFRFAERISGSLAVALAAVLFGAFHGAMIDLYNNTAVIYDILCFAFYLSASNVYLAARRTGGIPGVGRMIAIAVLYALALGSKEMAVTLPVVLLAYEWSFHRSQQARGAMDWTLRDVLSWTRKEGRAVLLCGLMTAAYIPGKLLGSSGFLNIDAYRPVLTWDRFVTQQALYANAMLNFRHGQLHGWILGMAWVALLAIAWWKGPRMVFVWVFMAVSTLPITFLEGRTWSCLYLPVVGWSLYAAMLFLEIGRRACRWWRLTGMERRMARAAFVLVPLLWHSNRAFDTRDYRLPLILEGQQVTWNVIADWRRLHPAVRSGQSVLILDDPFTDLDAYFIAALWFRDPGIRIVLGNKMTPPPDAERTAKFDWVFRFDEGKRLIQVKP